MKTCPIDKKKFAPKSSRQKFCSPECKQKDQRIRYGTADYNVRFFTPQDYASVKAAAAKADESMNLFIVNASLGRARAMRGSMQRAS